MRMLELIGNNMKIVLVTGGFDPLHSGHIAYFESARQLGDMLIVGINTDEWLVRKKGKSFMDEYERLRIIESLKVVDKVVCYPDADNSSKNTITGVRAMYPNATLIFANDNDERTYLLYHSLSSLLGATQRAAIILPINQTYCCSWCFIWITSDPNSSLFCRISG